MTPCLSIAGSDCSGGAGIQADLKTFAAHGVYGMSAITALTAQNTLGVNAIEPVSSEFVRQQLQAIFDDIQPAAIKVGMLVKTDIISVVAKTLAQTVNKPLVLDPVMVATSGAFLLDKKAVTTMIETLFPLTSLITPNIAEFIVLCETVGITPANTLENEDIVVLTDKLIAALPLTYTGDPVTLLVKGGHLSGTQSSDYFASNKTHCWLHSPRIDNHNTHGTGCTLAAAITANLSQGLPMLNAVQEAKHYISKVIGRGLDLGRGQGPLQH